MSTPAPEVRETLRLLRRTPQHLARTASGLTDAQLRRSPDDGGWSLNEVLAHIRGAADVQGRWIARILAEKTPKIRYASPRTGMRKVNHAAEEFQVSLGEFRRQRGALVATLSALDDAGWGRSATFTGTKPGWTQTVLDVARGIATHESSHFEQITATAHAAR